MNHIRSHRKGYDRLDYIMFGELTEDDMALLAKQASDTIRKRMLIAWYGHHGGRYAFERYAEWRNSGASVD